MARRKEDKLRPYRVDYFDIEEMQLPDKALVQSVVVRAVTASDAIDEVANSAPPDLRIIVRAYRFYKKLGARKKDVYKAVEDLFTANKAVEVMNQIEAYRREAIDAQFRAVAGKMPADPLASDPTARRDAELSAAQCPFGYPSGPNGTAHNCKIHKVEDWASRFDRSSSVMGYESIANSTLPKEQKDRLLGKDPNGHVTRFSDSSLYDEVCNLCGATDATGKLDLPCPAKVIDPGPKVWSGGLKIPIPTTQQQVIDVYQTHVPDDVPMPTSGPESVATKAVITDLDGMTAHDKHEQIMDNFVPTPGQNPANVAKNAALAEHGDDIAVALTAVKVEDCKKVGDTQSFTFPIPSPDPVRGLGFPDRPVVPTKPAVFNDELGGHWGGCGCESCVPPSDVNPSSDPANYVLTSTGDAGAKWKEPGLSLWAKLGIFAVIAVSLVLLVNALLSCPGK